MRSRLLLGLPLGHAELAQASPMDRRERVIVPVLEALGWSVEDGPRYSMPAGNLHPTLTYYDTIKPVIGVWQMHRLDRAVAVGIVSTLRRRVLSGAAAPTWAVFTDALTWWAFDARQPGSALSIRCVYPDLAPLERLRRTEDADLGVSPKWPSRREIPKAPDARVERSTPSVGLQRRPAPPSPELDRREIERVRPPPGLPAAPEPPMPLPSFDEFHAEWIAEIREASSTVEKGRRFARKLVTQWLDAPIDEEDIVYCDGAGDGGLDVALLAQGGASEAEETEGDTWYLVQAKYGTALQGPETIVNEGRKVVETLDGHRARLSSLTSSLLERLNTFRGRMGPQDRLVLVMATERALSEPERRALADVRAFGRERLGTGFDVEEVSVETIYLRQSEGSAPAIRVPITGRFVPAGDNLLVGVVPLSDLYNFLRTYRSTTHDLDRLYERNVRQFLGSKKKINKGIQHTLLQFPERFGLYNNGITVVVAGFEQASAGYLLTDPNIVNGCQTTRSVWEVLHPRLSAGGTGSSSAHQSWTERLAVGAVVCKIVRVGLGTDAISDITRYTNSQNAVREKDFIALERDFKSWQRVMEEQYGVYLEIQRGGWESRRALQNQNRAPRLDLWANAFDLLKVYGAGWMSEPGTAFGRNRDFTPDGAIFKRIMEPDATTGDGFGATDLYAAFRVQRAADGVGFGRGTEKLARRQSRFLFYFVFIELIRGIASNFHGRTPTAQEITSAVLKLRGPDEVWNELVSEAVNVIDEYLEPSDSDSTVFREESFRGLNNDLNSYLKSEKLGKDRNFSKCLGELIGRMRWSAGRAQGGRPSLRDRAVAALR